MKIILKEADEKVIASSALIIAIAEGDGAAAYKDIDKALGGMLSNALSSGEFKCKLGESSVLHAMGRIRPDRVMLVGLGKAKELSAEKLRQAGGCAAQRLKSMSIEDAALSARSIEKHGLRPSDMAEGMMMSQYCFSRYKTCENSAMLSSLTVLSKSESSDRYRYLETVSDSNMFSRDLINTPARDMTPSALVKAARSIKGVSVKVMERAEAARMGMHSFLSVSAGSSEPPKFIVITYKGGLKSERPIALIGKSVTFDSGGLSLKPSESMEHMKYDMAGGAAVLGAIRAASALKLKRNITGVLAATENLPGNNATKPGDIVRSIGGKTIEILNTDAEGRLTLADALGYADKFLKPALIINLATLTGACTVALGHEAAALMGNDEQLMKSLERASAETGEKIWRMPLYDDYADYLKSDIADIRNTSNRKAGGLVTGGYFLKEFVGDTPWAHLDIASTAWADKPKSYMSKGATAFGVRLLMSFLKNHN